MLQDQSDVNTGDLLEVLDANVPDWDIADVEIQTTMACWWDSGLELRLNPTDVSSTVSHQFR